MLDDLREGYELVTSSWDNYLDGLGTKYSEGNWEVSINADGSSVSLTGYGMIFIFPTKTVADVKYPESDNYKDYRSPKSLLADVPAAKITYEEIQVGLDVAAEALRIYKEESINIYCNQGWVITIEPEDKKSLYEKHLVMEKDDYKCQIPLAGLQDFISHKKSGEEFSGLIYVINTGLIEESLIPEIIGRRFLLYQYAKFIDSVFSEEIKKEEIDILKIGFLDLKNIKAQRLLTKYSEVKFHDLKRQYHIIKEISEELAKDLFYNAVFYWEKQECDGPLVPMIYFIGVSSDNILAQMCLWAKRQLSQLSSLQETLDTDEAKYLLDGLSDPLACREPILQKIIQNKEVLDEFILRYIGKKNIIGKRIDLENEASYITFEYLINHWKVPASKNSFDAYIFKTKKGLYRILERIDYKEGLTDSIDKYSNEMTFQNRDDTTAILDDDSERLKYYEAKKNKNKNKHKFNLEYESGYLTVKEAAHKLVNDTDLSEYNSFSNPVNNERWLYKKLSDGEIKHCGGSKTRLIREGVVKVSNTYRLDEESYEKAKQIILGKERRRALKDYIVENKKITERGANKYIKDNLKRGLSLEEITIKVVNQSSRG